MARRRRVVAAVAVIGLVDEIEARDGGLARERAPDRAPDADEVTLDPVAVGVEAVPRGEHGRAVLATAGRAGARPVGDGRPLRRAVPADRRTGAGGAHHAPRRRDVLAPGVLVHVDDGVDAPPGRVLDGALHQREVPLVDPARSGLETRPRHQQAYHVEAVGGHGVPVGPGDRHDRRQGRVVLVVVAERVQVDTPKRDLATGGVDDRGAEAVVDVQREQSAAPPVVRPCRPTQAGDAERRDREYADRSSDHGLASGGVGMRNSSIAFCQQMRRTSSSGTPRSCSRSRGWVSGQVESACG